VGHFPKKNSAKTMNAHPLLRTLVVGLGFGTNVHVPAFRLAGGYEVVGLVGRDTERARQAAAIAGIHKGYGSLSEAFRECRPDVVSIAVPPAIQPEIAHKAIKEGAHLFCEKPLAVTLDEACLLEETARAAARRGAIDFLFPEIPAWRKLIDLVEGGSLGAPRKAAVSWKVETRAARDGTVSWRTSVENGGGALFNFVSHSVHYLRQLFGKIVAVQSFPGENLPFRFLGALSFHSGMEAVLDVDCDAFPGLGHRLEVFFEKGTAVLENLSQDYASGFVLKIARRGAPGWETIAEKNLELSGDGRIAAVASILERLREGILSGIPIHPDLSDGLEVQRVIHALKESSESALPAISLA
jgi:predicted dehydrogenase